ncbi:hypothetical protein EFK69_10805 [Lactococcus lactis subsp. lactis]|nr:hypothetical protein [Lactococcus lactis subsp. lactis]
MRKWERAGAVDSLSKRQGFAEYWYTFMTTGGDSGTGGGSGITPDIPSGWTLDKPINTSGYIASSLNINNVLGLRGIERKNLVLLLVHLWEMVLIGNIKQDIL